MIVAGAISDRSGPVLIIRDDAFALPVLPFARDLHDPLLFRLLLETDVRNGRTQYW
jgi:hypothetical protein